MKSGRQTWSE